jgi:hypothetical protein
MLVAGWRRAGGCGGAPLLGISVAGIALHLPPPGAEARRRKRALGFYAKAKAIRHSKSMDAATQPTQSA